MEGGGGGTDGGKVGRRGVRKEKRKVWSEEGME